jgi:hypothetical protein
MHQHVRERSSGMKTLLAIFWWTVSIGLLLPMAFLVWAMLRGMGGMAPW